MPEYLAPGVFVEETSFRPKSIQGVGTSTTAFAGPTRKGPLGLASDVITSFPEFERLYGGLGDLVLGGNTRRTNHMAHGAKAFFDNGGARLYVARTFTPRAINGGAATQDANSADAGVGDAGAEIGFFRARFPGAGLNGVVIAYLKAAPAAVDTLNAAPTGSLAGAGDAFWLKAADGSWADAAGDALQVTEATLPDGIQLLTLNIEMRPGAANRDADAEGGPVVYERLGFGPGHPRRLADALAHHPTSRGQRLAQPYWFDQDDTATAFTLRAALFPSGAETVFILTGGDDGAESVASDNNNQIVSYEDALAALGEIEDIAIVAAPGHSAAADPVQFRGTRNALITHARNMRYRVAVLDTPEGVGVGDAREVRGQIDSTYAALYYPWVVVPNPAARPTDDTIPKELALPPSGFVCGIYARNDITRGVWKAPANEVVQGALRFEREVTRGEQEVLNPEGINCLRSFFGRGHRVWGARTVSSDPEWMYVNVRRYFIYLEHSIDRSTQWAVFEPNGPRLWSNITDTVSSFLFAEWRSGALLGASPDEAYFVRCDRSTMTQADLDNGRLICEIGVAVVKPAEFVIFRIGQKTADA
ncbi:MAG: phage tail sheath subtilisin-like domain-containing protein [Alphaproteobacteria bacterium]|nr:phage tail sheath subtilisin-like domain-containing protein [Alphaproteobacteria bacterium]